MHDQNTFDAGWKNGGSLDCKWRITFKDLICCFLPKFLPAKTVIIFRSLYGSKNKREKLPEKSGVWIAAWLVERNGETWNCLTHFSVGRVRAATFEIHVEKFIIWVFSLNIEWIKTKPSKVCRWKPNGSSDTNINPLCAVVFSVARHIRTLRTKRNVSCNYSFS